jgi:hypothetical protein
LAWAWKDISLIEVVLGEEEADLRRLTKTDMAEEEKNRKRATIIDKRATVS